MKKQIKFNTDTIPEFLYRRAKTLPNNIAYSFPEFMQEYSWSRIWAEVNLLSKSFLRLGIKKGDRIALLMQGRMELILSIYASACIGAIAVPLNTYSKKNELKTYLQDSTPKILIMDSEAQHQDYLHIIEEIIEESHVGVPTKVFVLQDKNKMKWPFRPYTELTIKEFNQEDDQAFLSACQMTCKNDPIIIFYTSGTTGVPKAVVRSTASFLTSVSDKRSKWVNSLLTSFGDRITAHFPIMNLLPLYHLGGFSTIFITLKACHIPIIMLSHFNPVNALTIIEKEKCRFLIGTPFMIQQILSCLKEKQHNLNSLIGLVFSSSAVNRSIIRKVTKELNLLFFIVGYGSTEAGTVANGTCFLNRRRFSLLSCLYQLLKRTNLLCGVVTIDKFERNPYSLAGRIEKNVEVKIINPRTGEKLSSYEHGEICIRSHRVMRYKNEETNNLTNDGWFRSGDLGFLDEEGLLTITDRLKRMISRGGEKISPAEIENALLTIKEVNDIFVIGVLDELYGEQVCACVILEKGTKLTGDEIRNKLSSQISAFKIPKYILFFSEFPMSPTGKVSSVAMQQLAHEQLKGYRKNA